MAEVDVENNSSYGAMERFLIWFLIPFVFTAVLLGVLMTIFGYDVTNNVLRAANKIPIVNTVLPAPKDKSAESKPSDKTAQQQAASAPAAEETAQALNSKLEQKDQELKKTDTLVQQRDQTIKELQLKNSTLEEQMKAKTQNDDEYTAKVQQLASMYAKMSPSKAGPIMENLTTAEMVLVLSMMKVDERVKVLEKMNPKMAADASILLKDLTSTKDKQIAALHQERLKQASTPETDVNQKLSKEDLGATFSSMTPKSAATVLLEIQNTNPAKVISILSSMDSAGRSKILTAISEQSKETAALISTHLAQ
ncbi:MULTISPECIES: MotE family protein [unclassified Paenibacillus]|uniref:MotE family protein n=1 Tax=unclassified Paenibacillus TaxID=185978 RepID=UPI003627F41C